MESFSLSAKLTPSVCGDLPQLPACCGHLQEASSGCSAPSTASNPGDSQGSGPPHTCVGFKPGVSTWPSPKCRWGS